ncbi:MAG: transposase [Phycisphaerales bacterium]|nr:transposase [Phycisphaerales bacterium]
MRNFIGVDLHKKIIVICVVNQAFQVLHRKSSPGQTSPASDEWWAAEYRSPTWLVHLLRELEKVDRHNESPAWRAFAKALRRLIRDGIRLRKRRDFTPEKYRGRILRIGRRLDALIAAEVEDVDARRLLKRLRRTGDHLFTFLDYPQIPFENNFAERQIRPAVILRKNSQSNRSDRGALTQAVLMSIYRTLRLRGHDPLRTISQALRTYLQTGKLPPLPVATVADG